MSSEAYSHVEQDPSAPTDGDELPSYDDLAAQNGPNSRFGRWRGWIEKRAAERYADITPQERERRRARGWDLEQSRTASQTPQAQYTQAGPQPQPPQQHVPLHIQTNNLSIQDPPLQPQPSIDDSSVSLPFVSENILPSHLKINHFGSRFLPHATSQIRCILPLMADRLILIGHDEGLSVLDMFPQEVTPNGEINVKPPNEAVSHLIWRGETIYQMTILELEESGEGSPQGVVLALVGPEPDSHSPPKEEMRTLRMYNLSSLTSLARWAVSQKGSRPLDLYRPSNWQAQHQSPPKRHRHQGSIARSLKSLITDQQSTQPEPTASYQAFLSPTVSVASGSNPFRTPPASERGSPTRLNAEDSAWDVVDDLPLRWATDYVPLASPGSRLANTSVLSYATWANKNRQAPGGQLLAIATKNSILLYESPKGERAYRFVKDFYTPLQPKQMSFFMQNVQQEMPTRASSGDSTAGRHGRSGSSAAPRQVMNDQANGTHINYGSHISLFVIFEKKASWILIANSTVGEFELREDGGPPPNLTGSSLGYRDSLAPSISSTAQRTRSRLSFEIRESGARWSLPTLVELPIPTELNQFSSNAATVTKPVYIMTRGRRTHIVQYPIPSQSTPIPPIHVVYWKNPPKNVSARVCRPSKGSVTAAPRFTRHRPTLLQLVAFGENGLEVYETTVMSLFNPPSANGKGKGRVVQGTSFDSVRAEQDLGGLDAAYLQPGGNWDQALEVYGGIQSPYLPTSALDRNSMYTPSSALSYGSSLESEAISGMLKEEIGMYGWCKKGYNDFRVFWVGGSYEDVDDDDESLYA
ncbi:hypothetical protein FA15DRAFT_691415 [Coprinopsis marcescibilis]|uniref:Uncharacterized protein n=1 Tax=Coprinopsis marcescibilis TaxID=230819 RepID=A0A5C3L7C9_COPMA|nr:hypothetical protein FA15DRAFT_691415 [Coprinopsis marcescibilis]